jgi:hypothetical protein
VKETDSPERLKVDELREAVADDERRLAELVEETRRVQSRLAALRADLESTGPSVAQANLGASLAIQQPTPTPRSSAEKIALFRSLFRGRDDVYPVRFVSKRTGKSGYAPACANKFVRGVCDLPRIRCGECSNQAFLPVDDAALHAHLTGKQVMGVYPLLPDETCWFLAIDFDGASWSDDVRAFAQTCAAADRPSLSVLARAMALMHGSFSPRRFPPYWLDRSAVPSSPIRCLGVTNSACLRTIAYSQAKTRCRAEASVT